MEKFETPSPEYVKAFNQGYMIAKEIGFTTNSFAQIPESLHDTAKVQGLVDGMKQYGKEQYLAKVKGRIPEQSKDTPKIGKSNSPDMGW